MFNKNKISSSGNISSHYGVGYALNPKYYNKEKVNVVRIDDCFVQINFKNFNVIACYLPQKQLLQYFNTIREYINENTILIGDFNADLECPRSSEEVELINLLTDAGLEYQQYKDYFSYQKNKNSIVLNEKSFGNKNIAQVDLLTVDNPSSFRKIGCSKIDHCLVRNYNDSIKSINVYTEECSLNFSDHKCLCAQIDLHQEDGFIVGKQPRLRVHKLAADYKMQDGKRINVNEQNLFNYQHAINLQWSNQRVDRGWLEMGINNTDRHAMDRQQDMDKWIDLLDKNLFESLDATVKQTKAMTMIENKDLERIYGHQQNGNTNLAKELINNLHENYVETFADKINQMKDYEVQKVYKAHRNRIKRPGASLDQNQILDYWEKCDSRWDLFTEVDPMQERYNILGNLPIGTGVVPEVCSKENLNAIIKGLPNNKSPGRSRIPYEAYKYAGDQFNDYIYDLFTMIIQTGIIPSQWSINSIIPIHKRNDTANFKNYRPLGLSEALRKIFEAFIGLAIEDLFISEHYHYGYKKNHSTSDAAFDLDQKMKELRNKGVLQDYVLFKLDIQSAFDKIDHGSLKEFLETFIQDPFFRHIMLSLLMIQRVRLCLGAITTFYKRLRCGIIQGSKLSPKVFLALLNWCLKAGSINIPGFKYIYADDFLVLCKKEEAGLIKELIVEKLDLMGLTLSSDPGKCADIEEEDKWLGFYISKEGLSVEGQVNRNLQKAAKQAAMLRSGGIFKNRIYTHIILRVWASRVLPVLEYGLNGVGKW